MRWKNSVLNTKTSSASGGLRPPDQLQGGFAPWPPPGALPLDPRYRLSLPRSPWTVQSVRHELCSPKFSLEYALLHCTVRRPAWVWYHPHICEWDNEDACHQLGVWRLVGQWEILVAYRQQEWATAKTDHRCVLLVDVHLNKNKANEWDSVVLHDQSAWIHNWLRLVNCIIFKFFFKNIAILLVNYK